MATLDLSGGLDEILARTPNLADKVSAFVRPSAGNARRGVITPAIDKGTRTLRVWLVIAEV